MKRMFYVSRFARPLTRRDLRQIHESAVRYNRHHGITGILVCLGDTFFQVLEGKRKAVDEVYHDRILQDRRHKDIHCLKTESGVRKRMFPDWNMQVFNLNEEKEVLPMAFREMLSALLESSHTIAQYTQPSVFRMLEQGVNPTLVKPCRKRVTVLFSDIVGFSLFAERLRASELIDLVNRHVTVCTHQVNRYGGEVNKLLGDGVLAYFSQRDTDTALDASVGILQELQQLRSRAKRHSPAKLLFGGVGLANGMVYEGNVGPTLKRDFTILGNTVNIAARLESYARQLNTPITIGPGVKRRATARWSFRSLGHYRLKGQSRATEVLTLSSIKPLDIAGLYRDIKCFLKGR